MIAENQFIFLKNFQKEMSTSFGQNVILTAQPLSLYSLRGGTRSCRCLINVNKIPVLSAHFQQTKSQLFLLISNKQNPSCFYSFQTNKIQFFSAHFKETKSHFSLIILFKQAKSQSFLIILNKQNASCFCSF